MLDKEFNSSKEDNVFKEIKNFPPETYFKVSEIKSTPPENSAKCGEIGMPGTPSKKRKKEVRSNFNNESNSSGVTESAAGSSVGSTAISAAGGVTVAAAAVAVTMVAISGLIAPAPNFNVQRLEAGCDYVLYELYLEDISEDMDYFVSVTHKNEEYVQELDEGLNENVIENLLPNKAYVFSLKGEDTGGAGTVTYYQTTVYTTNIISEDFADSYASTFNESFTEEVEVFWDEDGFNRITFPVNFEKQADGECLRIVAYDGSGTEYARVDCDGQTAELNVPASAVDVIIEYQKVAKLDDKEKVYETLEGGALDFDYGVTINDAVKIIGNNYGEISIDFNNLNGTLVSAGVTYDYGDGEFIDDIIFEDLYYGQYEIEFVNYGSDVFSLTAEIEVEGPYGGNLRRFVIEKDYALEPVFEVKGILYHLAEYSSPGKNYVTIDINFWGESTAVVKVDDGTTITDYTPGEINFKYEESETRTFKYALFDGDQQLTDWVEFVLTPNVIDENYTYDFSQSRTNPSAVLTTYNADGTVNYYIPMMFSCEDPDVLYEVVLGNEICYTGRDYCCAIENMPRGPLGLRVNVYKMLNGVKHTIYEFYPSGTLGEEGCYLSTTLTKDEGTSTITIKNYISNSNTYDYDSFVITAGGETYTLSAADFIEDTESNYMICTLTIPQLIESATVTFYANATTEFYEQIAEGIEIKGELLKEYVIEIY